MMQLRNRSVLVVMTTVSKYHWEKVFFYGSFLRARSGLDFPRWVLLDVLRSAPSPTPKMGVWVLGLSCEVSTWELDRVLGKSVSWPLETQEPASLGGIKIRTLENTPTIIQCKEARIGERERGEEIQVWGWPCRTSSGGWGAWNGLNWRLGRVWEHFPSLRIKQLQYLLLSQPVPLCFSGTSHRRG